MSTNNRKHHRIGVIVDIDLIIPNQETITVKTRNISDGGLYLIIDDIDLPEIDSIVKVRLKNQMGDGEQPPINEARVVRHETDGVGLMFLE